MRSQEEIKKDIRRAYENYQDRYNRLHLEVLLDIRQLLLESNEGLKNMRITEPQNISDDAEKNQK